VPLQKLVTHKIPLTSPAAPPPAPFLSSAILHRDGNIVYVSGALGIKAGHLLSGGIERRFEQAISNASALLREAKASLADGKLSFPAGLYLTLDPCMVCTIIVVAVTIYLANISRDIIAINKAFEQAFQGGVAPTLTVVETSALPLDTDVEVTWYV
jgi:enamine deaminase RidA (YjgF/YER057c/UK114 family)